MKNKITKFREDLIKKIEALDKKYNITAHWGIRFMTEKMLEEFYNEYKEKGKEILK